MGLTAQILQDAKNMIDEFGEQITYTPAGGSALTINAIATQGEISPRQTDRRRSLHYNTVIVVSKIDVPTVTRNADMVVCPGAWFEESGTVTKRVAEIIERFDKGQWLLGIE